MVPDEEAVGSEGEPIVDGSPLNAQQKIGWVDGPYDSCTAFAICANALGFRVLRSVNSPRKTTPGTCVVVPVR
jgi:hypothetical protein